MSDSLMSPLRSQPSKKMRGGSTPVAVRSTLAADETVARRRAELRRLQLQRQQRTAAATGPSTSVPPAVSTAARELLEASRAAPVPPKDPIPLERVRHSDIFPSVPKSSTTNPPAPPQPVNRKLEYSGKKTTSPRSKSAPRERPPPPPPVLAAATTAATSTTPTTTNVAVATDITAPESNITMARTPAPPKKPELHEVQDPPSTVRRDKIRSFALAAESPARPNTSANTSTSATNANTTTINSSTTNLSETTARLEAAYEKAELEKRRALQKVAELEIKLAEQTESSILSQPSTPSRTIPRPDTLQQLLHVADTVGEEQALKWAREQISGVPKLSSSSPAGRFTPSKYGMGLPVPPLIHQYQHTLTPNHPVMQSKKPQEAERQYIAQFREAVQYIPNQYEGDLATFFVRRPYGMETDQALFAQVSDMPHDQYSKRAHVSTMSALQVAASVHPDQTLLLLSDVATARYNCGKHDPHDFVTVENALAAYPLGTIPYVDAEAKDQDYNLDTILQEAIRVRELYASAVTHTALSFVQRPAPVEEEQHKKKMVPMEEIAVDTSDLPGYPPVKEVVVEQNTQQDQSKTKEAADVSPSTVMQHDSDDTGSEDVFLVFVGMIVQSVVGLIYWILIGLPLSAIRWSFTLILSLALLGIIYGYALESARINDFSELGIISRGNEPGIL